MGSWAQHIGSYYYACLIVLTDELYQCKHRRNDQCYLPADNELNTIDSLYTVGLQQSLLSLHHACSTGHAVIITKNG